MKILKTIEEADTAWLTHILQKAGVLPTGRVEWVEVKRNAAFNSTVAHLTLTFSIDATNDAPNKLILKLNQHGDGENEVGMYQLVGSEAGTLPMILRCFSAEYSTESGESHCLLIDLSEGHGQYSREQFLTLQTVPPDWCNRQVIKALAEFHAYWWEHPRLGSDNPVTQVRWWYRDKQHYEQHIERRTREYAQFRQDYATQIPSEWLQIYDKVLANLPALWERYLEPRVTNFHKLTITNGDFYYTQWLYDLKPDGQGIIIDFQDASANFGAYDLVFLLASFWTREQRQANNREENLLRLYYDTLLAQGVENYSWENLQQDYRLMLSLIIFLVVWDATAGSSKAYWFPKMSCLLEAYQDWNCVSLVD